MSFKVITKGDSAYYCDVCNERIPNIEKMGVITYQRFWKENVIELCSKHGKEVRDFIQKLREGK